MALKDIIKFEDSFVSQGGISPAVGTLNGTYEAGRIGQGYRSFRTGGELSYTPSDFGIDLNSNSWGFIIWAKPNKTSLDTVASRHELMNIGTYYDLGETDIYVGFHSGTTGTRNFTCGGVYQNQVAKSGLNSVNFDDWTVQNWFLFGIWADGNEFGRMVWDPVEGLRLYNRTISWDSNTYPFQDKLIISGYNWDLDNWGGSVDELRIYDGRFNKKEFLDLAKGKQIHYTFNTDQQTIENEFYDNWSGLVDNAAIGPGTLQVGATDPFGNTDSSVFRTTGKVRFGNSAGTDIGTLYNGSTYTFSIYLRHVYDEPKTGSGEFDIADRTGERSFSGSLGDNMNYTWKRFWTTALHDNNSNYHFIDIGTASGSNVFEWCCPQIEKRVRFASNGLTYYSDPELNVSEFTEGRTGVINDDSGNGNDVTLTYANSPYYNSDASDGRKAALFPGENTKKIVLGVDNSTNIENFSWACWAFELDPSAQHTSSIKVSQYIMSQGRDTGIYGANIFVSTNDLVYGRYYGSGGVKTLSSGEGILDGWHHLAMTYDISVGGKLYIDGDLKDSDTAVGEIDYNNYNFVVGKMAHAETGTSFYFPFNGYIDDVRVYGSTLDASAIMEIYQQKAYIDQNGNFGTDLLQETGHVPLIIDYTEWTEGTGSLANWTLNGDSAENLRSLSDDPWGNRDRIVWEALPNGTGSADGGWNTAQFPIDNTKMYRFSTWVQRNGAQGTANTGSFYLGLNGYGSVDGVLRRDTGANNTNPYFINGFPYPTPGRWELMVGHVWPVGSGTGLDHPESGRYDVNGLITTSAVLDYVWRSETTTARHRSYLFYSSEDVSVRQYWYYPRVDVMDGTEPSIEELINGFDGRYYDYINNVLKSWTNSSEIPYSTFTTDRENIIEARNNSLPPDEASAYSNTFSVKGGSNIKLWVDLDLGFGTAPELDFRQLPSGNVTTISLSDGQNTPTLDTSSNTTSAYFELYNDTTAISIFGMDIKAHVEDSRSKNYLNLDVGISSTKVGKLSEISVDSSLLLWYPLQGPYTPAGDAYEMVKGEDGNITGDPSVMGRGYYFDGAEVIEGPDLSDSDIIGSSNAAELTFSAWANRRTSINDYNMIMGQLQPWLSFRSSNVMQFSAIISGTQRTATSGSTYSNGEWNHVVGTYDGTYLRIYVNGVEDGSAGPYTGGITLNGSYVFTIANWHAAGTYEFDGTISDARVYNRGLTAEQVKILYDTTNPEGTNSMKLSEGKMYLKGELKE